MTPNPDAIGHHAPGYGDVEDSVATRFEPTPEPHGFTPTAIRCHREVQVDTTMLNMTDLTPRREATVGRLVKAAITQFATRGIDATSVEHLCEAAGFSRGAFYSNFTSKDDLCIAVAERYRDDVQASLPEAVASLPSGEDIAMVADAALERFLKILSPSREMTITLLEIRMRALRNPKLAAHLERINTETRPTLVNFVDDLAKHLGISFVLPTEYILDLFEALYYFEFNRYGKYSIRPLLTPLTLFLIRSEAD